MNIEEKMIDILETFTLEDLAEIKFRLLSGQYFEASLILEGYVATVKVGETLEDVIALIDNFVKSNY